MQLLKVSSISDPAAAAGAIANWIRETGTAESQAIGPRAVNQAVKAVAIARSFRTSQASKSASTTKSERRFSSASGRATA